MNHDDLDGEDRALERADACSGCRQHHSECVCPTRLPTRLRLVGADQPSVRERREHRRGDVGSDGPVAA